jgi:hypothetical protein
MPLVPLRVCARRDVVLYEPGLLKEGPEIVGRAIAESGDLACSEAIKTVLLTSGTTTLA